MRNSTVSKLSRISKALEKYMLDPYELPPLFFNGNDREKLVLEIGFGNGELITRMAQARKKDRFVGVESSEISCEKAAKRAYTMELENVKFMRGDGKFLAREFFANGSVDLVLAFYPIPWPKESQEGKRLFERDFLKTISSILKPSGKFLIVTDDESYFKWTLKNFEMLQIKHVTHHLNPIRATKYGRKWESLGRESWSILAFHKEFSINRILEGEELPHVHVKNVDEKKVVEKLKELAHLKIDEKDIKVEFKGFFKGENEYILKSVGIDGKFPQMYYIAVKRRSDGWLVRLDDVAKVFKTPAVKRSIEYVGNSLKKL